MGSDLTALESDAELRARINAETAKIAWHELQRFFAQGYAVGVAPGLDLIDVAVAFSRDDNERVAVWMEAGRVGPVSDSQALEWFDANALMWCVVVRPWVLVQPLLNDQQAADSE